MNTKRTPSLAGGFIGQFLLLNEYPPYRPLAELAPPKGTKGSATGSRVNNNEMGKVYTKKTDRLNSLPTFIGYTKS